MVEANRKVNDELLQALNGLIGDWEYEIVEFKQATNSFSQHDIGKYFSAISNEANLKGLQFGWLIFGVDNKTKKIVNTDYRDKQGLESLKHEIAQNTTGGITFIDIFEVYDGNDRIVMFKIPAAVIATPTAWKGHWYGRDGESLVALSQEEIERIRGQVRFDWSAQLIEDSTIDYLDKDAIGIARRNYKEKQNRKHISTEVDKMNNEEFLTKLGLIMSGRLTNAAMVLLGNPDYDRIINTPVRIMWRLFGSDTLVKDYLEFCIPYISVVDQVYTKIRNLTYRYLPDRTTLFPTVTTMYNEDLLKELLNNSIAHMRYTSGGRIYLDEFEDMVTISNPGNFIPGDIRRVLKPDYTAPYYRNQLLAEAMMMLDMIDTVQMGIRKIFNIQRSRYFPMPDYVLDTPDKVAVKVYGKVLDNSYTKLLFDREDLDLDTVYMLDRVQKKLPLDKEQYKQLRHLGVIEGKVPNVYISLNIAKSVDERAQYTKNKAMDDKYYRDLMVNYLEQFGSGSKSDFIKLLSDKLSDVLSDKQKEGKVKYLLATLKKDGAIKRSDGNHRTGAWVLDNNKQ
jgi:ATP-dependent DNA helicase RecG